MLDLHAAPGVQAQWQSFAGRIVEKPEFYTPDNYGKCALEQRGVLLLILISLFFLRKSLVSLVVQSIAGQ